ncbi:dihydroorotate dehydrogenase electron transfer subunit [Mollicutes bacterium LVI A0039]|nr:dihydroorotate dehydrogenase electron transfer subunit [Mollicutes bacterium LVI A0039]
MEILKLNVLSHKQLAVQTFELVLQKPLHICPKPGQFAMVKVEGKFLKRPLSISDYTEETITFIYKVLGEGTKLLSESKPVEIEVLLPLGSDFERTAGHATLIAGGVGIAPMACLARELAANGATLDIHLGYQTANQVFLADKLSEYGNVTIYTEDGSCGQKGYCLPTEVAPDSVIYGCGPHPMLNAIANQYPNQGWLSTEEYMACGFGICAGCVIKLKSGLKKVCQDGPVFAKEEFEC